MNKWFYLTFGSILLAGTAFYEFVPYFVGGIFLGVALMKSYDDMTEEIKINKLEKKT